MRHDSKVDHAIYNSKDMSIKLSIVFYLIQYVNRIFCFLEASFFHG